MDIFQPCFSEAIMSRIKLLQAKERHDFDMPVSWNLSQQQQYFAPSEEIVIELNKLRHPCSKIGVLLQWGYFKFHGRFFEVVDFREQDIGFITKQLKFSIKPAYFYAHYHSHLAYEHRQRILSLLGWKPFDPQIFTHQIERLVEQQFLPRKVLWESKAYLFRQGMEAPAYDKYLRTINEALITMSKRINELLVQSLRSEHLKVLDEFLLKKEAHQPAVISHYKTINQSNKPQHIKKSVIQFNDLKTRLTQLKDLVEKMNLSDECIAYHAHWASIADNDKIEAHTDKYLFYFVFSFVRSDSDTIF